MCFRVFWGAFFPFYLPGLWLLAFVGWLYARGAELQICTRIVWLVDPVTLGTSKHCSSQVLSRCFDVLARLVKKSKAMYLYATLWFQDVHVPFQTLQAFSAVVEALLALDRLQRESGLVVRWTKNNEDERIHTFSSTVRCWNLAVFCMNLLFVSVRRPEDVGLFFYKAAVNLTHLRHCLGWLFDARVRRDDSVMMPDSHW